MNDMSENEAAEDGLCELLRVECAKLGSTASDIAAALAAKQITGIQDDPCECPLARYLRDGLELSTVYVNGDGIACRRAGVGVDMNRLPPGVEEFLDKFDDGSYPALIDRGGV